MFKLVAGNELASIFYDAFENLCIQRAINDLIKDICCVSGSEVKINSYLPEDHRGKLIVGSLKNDRFTEFLDKIQVDVSEIDGLWEHFVIRTIGEKDDALLIAGSDERGTMWGIYEFSRLFLGTDPLYLWTDHVPEKKVQIEIPETYIVDGPKTFKFRGWFINDEDLIEGFSKAGVPEKGYDFHRDFPETLEMIVETALRLKQNMIIPCSHLNIDKPEEENLIRIVTERGLYISMHHQEPVGVHQLTMDAYWKKRGFDDINYFEHKEKYEQVWRHYIKKWSRFDNVIWQLGLRGRGDRPFWYNAAGTEFSIEEKGNIISDAIKKQLDIIKEENPGKEILSTSTLWMEGMELYQENVLAFPQGTMIIFADFGPTQMWGDGYYISPRDKGREYGVYYHVGFWGCGPHLVQGNFPEKIYYNYRNAVDKGDNAYSILNVANFREHVFGIKCVADITWDIESFDAKRYYIDWCKEQYRIQETEDAKAVADIYSDYFKCFYEMESDLIPRQMLFMDGMSRRVALKLMEIIRGAELKQVDIQNRKLFDFRTADEFIAYYKDATEEGIRRFRKLYTRAVKAVEIVAGDRQSFYITNMIVQIEIILGLYTWVYNLCLAAEDRRNKSDDSVFVEYLDEAVYALSKIIMDRKKASWDKWEHWYDGDLLINVSDCLEMTKSLYPGKSFSSEVLDILNSKF